HTTLHGALLRVPDTPPVPRTTPSARLIRAMHGAKRPHGARKRSTNRRVMQPAEARRNPAAVAWGRRAARGAPRLVVLDGLVDEAAHQRVPLGVARTDRVGVDHGDHRHTHADD